MCFCLFFVFIRWFLDVFLDFWGCVEVSFKIMELLGEMLEIWLRVRFGFWILVFFSLIGKVIDEKRGLSYKLKCDK